MVQEKGWKKVRNAFNIVRIPILWGGLCGKMKRKQALWAALFVLGLALTALGAANGGARDVLAKAIQICSECIGLG